MFSSAVSEIIAAEPLYHSGAENGADIAKDRSLTTAVFCVGIDLSSRSVSRQVLSALVSLTSVFGMGTGGPSPLKTPTIYLGLTP